MPQPHARWEDGDDVEKPRRMENEKYPSVQRSLAQRNIVATHETSSSGPHKYNSEELARPSG